MFDPDPTTPLPQPPRLTASESTSLPQLPDAGLFAHKSFWQYALRRPLDRPSVLHTYNARRGRDKVN